MSSTPSSNRQESENSATEVLASRYRHLFVLPPTPLLLLYAALVTLLLSVLLDRNTAELTFAFAFSALVASALAVSSALHLEDPKTVATPRRMVAATFAGGTIWAFCTFCGAAYGYASGSPHSLADAAILGAFICAGFEFLIINGVFTKRTSLSFILAAVYPVSTSAALRLEPSGVTGVAAVGIGALAFTITTAFILFLITNKTSRGRTSLSLFRSFMKTWTGGETDELEAILSEHSEHIQVSTKVMRFRTGTSDVFVVLPGIHPGPFYPLGSYDLPGEVSRAFMKEGKTMTLHRPGGHERNLVAATDTTRYASRLAEFSRTIAVSPSQATVKGPVALRVGKATVSAWALSRDLVTTISFAPSGSDDLSPMVEDVLARQGASMGFETWVADAHNSIDLKQESPEMESPGWKQLFEAVRSAEESKLRVAYSHSSELGFIPQGDMTENGLSMLMFDTENSKSVLVLADSNNAVPTMRSGVSEALVSAGYHLIEFCTSDTHNLAAKGLTVARGYKALGEETPVQSIAALTVGMAKLAETRLAPCFYGSGELITEQNVFGAATIKEFAAVTQSSSRYARRYAKLAGLSIAVLLIASLLI